MLLLGDKFTIVRRIDETSSEPGRADMKKIKEELRRFVVVLIAS